MVDAALSYAAQGLRVFPVKQDKTPYIRRWKKEATHTQQGVREYWERYPDANIGIVTEGLIVIDFDIKNDGMSKSKPSMEREYGLPRTRTHRTGSGGLHYIYRNPNGKDVRNTVNLGGYSGVDLRANGGYIVAPPSLHESGNRYEVLDYAPIAPAPQCLINLALKKARKPDIPIESELITEGQRNHTLTRIAGKLKYEGREQVEIHRALQDANEMCCRPLLPEGEVLNINNSVAKYSGGFSQIPNSAWGRQELNIYEQSAYLYLCKCSNNGQEAYPSYAKIASQCRMSRKSAIKAIQGLESKGFIRVEHRPRGNLDNETNIYLLPSVRQGLG